MNEIPTVFIVDDHAGVRQGLTILANSVGLNAEAFSSAEEFLDLYSPDRPGCIVLDVRMPGMGGLALLDQLPERGVDLPVIILTAHGDVSMATRAFKAGVVDFVEKPFADEALLDAIRAALQQNEQARQKKRETIEFLAKLETLSAREREILDLVVAGETTKSIAGRLELSPKTVDFHRSKLMEKMGALTVADLVRLMMTIESERGKT